ncbi:single-stranded DNA-binding protein [Alkalithermobacter paradoxus]|uniref:Single-stranded DNA-binding protein A n=1 Tax=Alkalithermobacter paradoxus TaxID=29349 RepID=A0A1V4I8U7_9FIRM|nr:single-stranded DNA-binding protein A [[Clostridium] thermoalcaliphilum]
MSNLKEITNVVNLCGEICSELEMSHEIFGEKFYNTAIRVKRLSDLDDVLPITISERLITDMELTLGKQVSITGQIRSYNKFLEGKNRLVVTVFVKEISEDFEDTKDPNTIFLDGYVCKHPIYRNTPLGREITDLLIAVNRSYNKSDYIPSIAWGRNAKFSKNLQVGDRVQIWGRMQSREYEKKTENGEVESKVAYEISISKMKKMPENNAKE